MTRSAAILVPASIRSTLFSASVLCMSTMTALPVAAGSPHGNQAVLQGYSMTPSGPSDHFVEGKYGKDGTYIPPHYQPVSKPAFHGYFFKKKPGDKNDVGRMGISAKSN